MMPIIFQQLIIASVLFGAFILASRNYGRWKFRKLQNAAWENLLPSLVMSQHPTLLYFWSAGCAQCKPQEYHIEQAKSILSSDGRPLHVLKLNAVEELDLAKALQVATVPTTIFIDTRRKVTAWNPGLTQARTLVEQYRNIF